MTATTAMKEKETPLETVRDMLLKDKNENRSLDYANGVLDMYNEIKKSIFEFQEGSKK